MLSFERLRRPSRQFGPGETGSPFTPQQEADAALERVAAEEAEIDVIRLGVLRGVTSPGESGAPSN